MVRRPVPTYLCSHHTLICLCHTGWEELVAPSEFFIRYNRYLAVDMWARTDEGEVRLLFVCSSFSCICLGDANTPISPSSTCIITPHAHLLNTHTPIHSPPQHTHHTHLSQHSRQAAWFGLVESRLRLLVDILDRDLRETPGVGQVRSL